MDHSAKALTRIFTQYRNSPKFLAWMDILPAIAQVEIEAPLAAISDILDIENNSGVLLEIAARIAGIQERPTIPDGSAIPGPLMPDLYFRPFIRAKIARNNSDATIDGIVGSVEFIAGSGVLSVYDYQDMSFSLIFSETLTDEVRDILLEFPVIPKPQGVRIRNLIEPPEDDKFFGYEGNPSASPYGVAPYASYLEPA